MLGRLLWLDRPDIKNAVCQLCGRESLCKKIEGCTLDVPAALGTPLGSVLVVTDIDWAGAVKDRKKLFWHSFEGQEQYCGNMAIQCMHRPRNRT